MTFDSKTCAAAQRAFAAGNPSAGAHIDACPVCRERLDQLARAVRSSDADEISCAEYRRRLDGGPDTRDPAWAERLAHHRSTCADCAELTEDTAAALAALVDPASPLPETTPDVDTAFLHAGASPSAPLSRRSDARISATGLRAAGLLLALLALLAILRIGLPRTSPSPPDGDAADASAGIEDAGARGEAGAALGPSTTAEAVAASRATMAARQVGRATRDAGLARSATLEASITTADDATATALAVAAGRNTRTPLVDAGATFLATASASPASPIPTVPPTAASPTESATEPLEPTAPDEPKSTKAPPASPTPPMDTLCMLGGRPLQLQQADCGPFDRMTLYDLHALDVPRPSRWTFSLCGRTRMDTLLVLYRADDFRTDRLCEGIVAYDDDFCGRQSRLTVELSPGSYLLMVADKTADAAETYALRVGAGLPLEGLACPRPLAPTGTETPPSPPPSPSPSPSPVGTGASPSPSPITTQAPTPGPTSDPSATPAPISQPTLAATPAATAGPGASPTVGAANASQRPDPDPEADSGAKAAIVVGPKAR